MKKIVRLTENDLIDIVKRVLNEQSVNPFKDKGANSTDNTRVVPNHLTPPKPATPKNIIPKYCINEVKEWADVDDDAIQTGTWILKGNKIQLNYDQRTFIGLELLDIDPDLLDKPIDFEQKMPNKKTGKFEKSFDNDKAPYAVCFL